MDEKISRLARHYQPLAIELLTEAVRIPADFVDRPVEEGGDPLCGLSNHEGPRLELLRRRILEIGAVDGPGDIGFDEFGSLVWVLQDPEDGIPPEDKTVIYWDGHTDTVQALRSRWPEVSGGGLDAYLGLVDGARLDRDALRQELGYLPPDDEWHHLLWGRGSADQLGGVISQIIASKILLELRSEGSLRGIIIRSHATVAEEDNDGGAPMFIMRHELPGAGAEHVPDVVILTEGTGCAENGAVGIYRGQRGRMQIEVQVTGKSCHGSMPSEGRNPLEFGGAMLAEAAERHARGEGFADDAFLGAGTRTASFASLETPSDCAVPERFTFRFDRRLTAGEDPMQAVRDIEDLPAVARAREAGLEVSVTVPEYDQPSWTGYRPGNAQIYPGWVTPEQHPSITTAAEAYRRCASPLIEALGTADSTAGGTAGALRKEPRVSRWVFSTDGVGFILPADDTSVEVPEGKRWVKTRVFRHPAMFGIGPGIEQNTHKIGECLDTRELAPVIAVLARFPSLYRRTVS